MVQPIPPRREVRKLWIIPLHFDKKHKSPDRLRAARAHEPILLSLIAFVGTGGLPGRTDVLHIETAGTEVLVNGIKVFCSQFRRAR